jgi:ATP-dependent exoDNAse (exonuclease V) alpha subunit
MPALVVLWCPRGSVFRCATTEVLGTDPEGTDDPTDLRTGDLVIVGRNDNRLGLYNGTRAEVTAVNIEAEALTLHTDDDREVRLSAAWAACHDLSHAYAMTLHKAQGLTVDHALRSTAARH